MRDNADQAQGAMLHDILASDYEHYSQVFDGFTLFTQATGRYKGTYPSVVYYMAGESPEPEADLVANQPFTWDYVEETLEKHNNCLRQCRLSGRQQQKHRVFAWITPVSERGAYFTFITRRLQYICIDLL